MAGLIMAMDMSDCQEATAHAASIFKSLPKDEAEAFRAELLGLFEGDEAINVEWQANGLWVFPTAAFMDVLMRWGE